MTLPLQTEQADSVQGSLTSLGILFACYVTLSAAGLVLAKRWLLSATIDVRAGHLLTMPVLGAALGAGAYAASFILWLLITTRAPLGVAYPVAVGVTMSLTTAAAALIFHERLSALQFLGGGLVLVGVALLSSGLRR